MSLRTLFITALLGLLMLATARAEREMLIVLGLGGDPVYTESFLNQAEQWRAAGEEAGMHVRMVGVRDDGGTWEEWRQALATVPREGEEEFWLVMIGHGTHDGRSTRFCLRQEDVEAEQLGKALAGFERPMVIAALSASSGPFLPEVRGHSRVVISATRSGDQDDAPYFPGFLAERIADPESDFDGDGQTSILEAFLQAAGDTEEFYAEEQRLPTEHALLDDNGDGKGTGAALFDGLVADSVAEESALPDGERALRMALVRSEAEESLSPALRERRNALELEMAALRRKKASMEAEEYYDALEVIALQLAEVYLRGEENGE